MLLVEDKENYQEKKLEKGDSGSSNDPSSSQSPKCLLAEWTPGAGQLLLFSE